MTAMFAVSQRSSRTVSSHLSSSQADTLRALLLAETEKHTATIAQCAAAIAANSADDATGLGRAMVALHMYGARTAIEEIDSALARIEDGRYGTCLTCDRPIPFKHLEAIPQARFCAACPASVVPPADGSAGPRLGPGRGEHSGTLPPPVRSPQQLDQPAFRTSANTRGDPIIR